MNKLLRNKTGADKIISVYWFTILFIVAAAVIYMVIIFYGSPYDVRKIETNILTDRIAGCFSQAGYMKENWKEINQGNFIQACGLNFNVEDTEGWSNDQYYTDVVVRDFNSGDEVNFVSYGNKNLKDFCGLEGKNLPVCIQRKVYSIDEQGSQYEIDILSIVRKTEKNVR